MDGKNTWSDVAVPLDEHLAALLAAKIDVAVALTRADYERRHDQLTVVTDALSSRLDRFEGTDRGKGDVITRIMVGLSALMSVGSLLAFVAFQLPMK